MKVAARVFRFSSTAGSFRDKRNGEAPSEFISHVAAVSWAETQQPETRLAIQSLRKTAFLRASQVDVFGGELVAMDKCQEDVDERYFPPS